MKKPGRTLTGIRVFVASLILLAIPASPAVAAVVAKSKSTSVSDLPAGPVKRTLLDAQRAARKTPMGVELIARPVAEAMAAMKRAADARSAADQVHAAMLGKLAAQWAETARFVVKAATAELAAKQAAKKASVAAEKLQRARALLAEQQARHGRLSSQLKRVEQRAQQAAAKAAEAERKRLDKAKGKKRRSKSTKRRGGARR